MALFILGSPLLLPAASLQSIWTPNGRVNAMLIFGGNLYFGGSFSQLVSPGATSTLARTNLAAINLSTGVPTAWAPGCDGEIFAMDQKGANILVGGEFGNAGGQPRLRLAELEGGSNTGAATAWNPGADGAIRAILVNGNSVYLGGLFSSAGGQARARLAEIDAGGSTGWANAWDPGVGGAGVYALKRSGSQLYVAGVFSSAGGQAREGLAILDFASNTATAFHPASSLLPGYGFLAMEVLGGRVFVGGDFSGSLGGSSSGNLAALNAGTGAAAWNPPLATDSDVRALHGDGAGRIFAGGLFDQLGPVPRRHLAALYESDGSVDLSFQADVNSGPSSVRALLSGGAVLAVGGEFTGLDGQNSPNLALVSLGALPTFTPTPPPTTPTPPAQESLSLLKVYPHPLACPGARAAFSMAEAGFADIKVMNLRGVTAHHSRPRLGAGPQAHWLECKGLGAGLYVLRVALEYDSGRQEKLPDYRLVSTAQP